MEKSSRKALGGGIIIGIIISGILAYFTKLTTITAMIGIFATIFVLLIAGFWLKDSSLNKGEIRRAITITFVVMYIVFLCLSLAPSNAVLDFEGDNTFINNFHNAILVILAFYFGSRAFEVGMGARTRIRDWATKIFNIPKAEDLTTGELKEEIKIKIEGKNKGDLEKLIKDMIKME